MLVGCLAGTILSILTIGSEVLPLTLPGQAPLSPELPLVLRGVAGAVATASAVLPAGAVGFLLFSVLLVVLACAPPPRLARLGRDVDCHHSLM